MGLLRSTALVSGMTLVSRVFGFLRDVVVAAVFGATAFTDAFFVAFRIPNLLRRWFAEGSFSLAFVPVLGDYRVNRSPEALRELIDAVAGTLLAGLCLIVGLGMLLAPLVVRAFAWGFVDDPELFALTERMLRITFPYALFICLTAMAGGILNTFGRFAVPAFTPVLLNLSLIAAALWLAPHFDPPVVGLAWGVTLAGLVQLLFQLPGLTRLGFLPRLRWKPGHPGVRQIGRLMLPTLLGSSVAQINVLVDTLVASFIASGAISWLYYADRLLEFPLGVFGIAISTVILPTLSRRYSLADSRGFSKTLDWALRLAALVSLPAAVGLALLAHPIIATLFMRGAFDATTVQMTATALVAYTLGLPAFVGIKVLAPAYYARQDTRTPVRIALLALAVNVVFNLVFVGLFLATGLLPAHVGLALASSLSAWVNVSLLFAGLARRTGYRAEPGWRRQGLVVAGASCAMGGLLWWLTPPSAVWLDLGLGRQALLLLVLVAGGALLYLALAAGGGLLRRERLAAPEERDQ